MVHEARSKQKKKKGRLMRRTDRKMHLQVNAEERHAFVDIKKTHYLSTPTHVCMTYQHQPSLTFNYKASSLEIHLSNH